MNSFGLVSPNGDMGCISLNNFGLVWPKLVRFCQNRPNGCIGCMYCSVCESFWPDVSIASCPPLLGRWRYICMRGSLNNIERTKLCPSRRKSSGRGTIAMQHNLDSKNQILATSNYIFCRLSLTVS